LFVYGHGHAYGEEIQGHTLGERAAQGATPRLCFLLGVADSQASLAEKIVDAGDDRVLRVSRVAPDDLVEERLHRAQNEVREHARVAGRDDAEPLPLAQAVGQEALDDAVERAQ